MEKTITIDDKKIRVKSTGGTARRYRNQFGKDLISDMMKLYPIYQLQEKGIDFDSLDIEVLQHLDFGIFENFLWAVAKTADDSIADPDSWFDEFDEMPIMDILPEIHDLMEKSMEISKKKY